ncbi:DUF429 domain-containing protein [Chitinimonas sp. JJ19]|uniref:DUF429 domain-containing protein n=1 Tax=Chitinimonas sp. JJ19 TaxID=3109352 RepID=UPI0030033EA7
MQLLGIDFTSRPTRRKPITVALGQCDGAVLTLTAIQRLPDFTAFEALLAQAGPWLAACDFPFSLPRALVAHQGWPTDWPGLMDHLAKLDRAGLRDICKAYCDARPAGRKFAHRATDLQARSSPSMKWVNPPVLYMLHEGAVRLRQSGITIAGLYAGDPARIALEGYPALAARTIIGNASYKSDSKQKQTAERRARRLDIVQALQQGHPSLGLRLTSADPDLLTALVEDPTADLLDAVLCLLQAAWASQQAHYGLPADMDVLEGWIISAAPD